MFWKNKFSLLAFLHIFCILQNSSSGFECKHDNIDLTALNGTWISWTDDTVDENISYKINLCSPLVPNGANDHACPNGASICMIFSNGTTYSAGDFNASADSLAGGSNEELGETWIVMAGDTCPADSAYNLTTSINFKCGPTMGSPVFLDYTLCVSYFEWETNIYCTTKNTVKEVPCYMYDDKGNRYDLSPLAKNKGGYMVSSEDPDTDIFINVCRDINPDSLTMGCPAGAAACKKSGHDTISLGEVTEGLKRGTDGRLTLKYTSSNSEAMAGCTRKPSTTIMFLCPERGASKFPLIVSDFDCQYVIEWETEHACVNAKLFNKSCLLTMEEAGIGIDLRPLKKKWGEPYKVSWNDTSSNAVYDFFLNICGDTGLPCPDNNHMDRVAACQTKQRDSDFGRVMGSTDHTQLSYADNKLTLTYKGGEKCHHNNFQRKTVINFICNQTAGNGSPEYQNEDECVYMFTWQTRLACLDHPTDESCRIESNGKKYDLGSLSRKSGPNRMALHEQTDLYGTGQYFVNVCHNVLQTGDASRCDPSAAICYREGLSVKNLGRYKSKPTFDSKTNSTIIKYLNGDVCMGTARITSTITFICKPGELESAPVLTQVSDDKCFYDFEWHTSAACPLGHYSGTNCKIYSDGFSFDLTPLRKATGYYTVNSTSDPEHEYYINVCGPVTGRKCDGSGITNVGICQEPASGNGDSYVAGQWTSELNYYDGMINLTYTGGTPYHDEKQTPRMSEIAFLCDSSAGIGKPRYLSEAASDHYYSFEWRTSYACPEQATQCTAVDEKRGNEYDISGLTMLGENNWAVDGPSNTKYYINVCQPLNRVPVGTGCDPFATICRTKFENGQEKMDIANMGQVTSNLQVVDEGRLKLTYQGGSCNNGTTNVPFIFDIEFMCRHAGLTSPPNAPLLDGPCEFTILWDTPVACPLQKDKDTESCTTKDPNTGYVYNLTPLTMKDGNPYRITVNGSTYKINICGNISESECPKNRDGKLSGVCQVMADGTKTSLAEARTVLDFSEVGVMSLVYDGVRLRSNGQRVNAKILFTCSPDQDLGFPVFNRKEGNTYVFTFFTALACSPRSIDCMVQDKAGKQYNLNPIINDNYWTAVDTRDHDTKYYINVCGPVQNVPKSECLDGPIGGCQVASNGKSFNMGYIQSKPIAISDGTVTIHYRNGDVCHKGKANEAHRSTRITFFCARTESGPVFVSETETCEYVFDWRTPAACPLQSASGGDCKVTEPLYSTLFDLNPLRSADYHVTVGDYEYIINVCGPLAISNQCGTNSDAAVGACQTKPHDSNFKPVNTGKGNANLIYDGGQLMLNYTGGDNNCRTLIKFSCDLGNRGDHGPQFVEKSEECVYVFDWPTYYACTPHESASCSVQDTEGNVIDLSVLELLNGNYEVTDAVEKKRYVLNVCRSVIHTPNATCPYNAAACMIDLTKPTDARDRYKSIGEPNGYQMKYENGHVVIVYDHGEKCVKGNSNMTTRITFTCDKNAKNSNPAGHFMVGDCDHHFLWTSAAACPRESSGDGGGDVVVPADITCRVTDSVTGNVYDFSSLKSTDKGAPYSVTDKEGHKYEFNICGPVYNSACDGKSASMGVCQSAPNEPNSQKCNAGNAVHNLWFDDGIVIQNMTGGDRCHNKQYERNTIISFVCNEHRGIGRPKFIDETEDCTYYISWHTSLVCRDEIKCSVDTDDYRTIDLSPLVQNPDHVVHSAGDGSIFYLSVCSALTPTSSVLCPAGSGVCQVKPSDGVKHTSLGKPKSLPTYDSKTKDVTIVYVNGSQCDTDPSKNFTSRVIFSCLPGPARSSPVFVSKTDCEYVFQWDTYLVCTEAPDDECGYHDTNTGDFYDFKKLQKNTPVEVEVNGKTKYLIHMCGGINSDDTSSCNSHMVCRKDGISFGEPNNYKVTKQGSFLKMTYDNHIGKCQGNVTAQSSIQFICDRNVGSDSAPIVLASLDCNVVFEWRTNVVCPTLENPCSIVVDNHLYDLSVLSKIHGAWNVTDRNKNTYYINICTSVGGSNVPAICDQTAAACWKSTDGNGDVIGLITAQKKLYKDSSTGALVLEYNEGSPCSKKRDHSASTKINFICGSTFGAPEFVDSEENKKQCIYEFNWKTRIACKVERENMAVSQGQLKDKQTGLIVDLKPIWNKSFTVLEKLDSGNENVYKLLLNGSSTQCTHGVICQINTNKQANRILGIYSSAKFSMDDWMVEATYTTGEKCAGGQSNVTSVIQFICTKKELGPRLLYRKNDCFYMFNWETTTACSIASHIVPSVTSASSDEGSGPGSSKHSSGKSGVSTTTIVGIVATFLGAIVLCILLVVFHKQDRREACSHRIRGLFHRGRSEYSQLPTGTMDDIFGDEDEVVTVQNAAGDTDSEEPIISVATTPASYHDDSDEDLLA